MQMPKAPSDRLITKLNARITSADTDMYKRIRLSPLVNFLIQSAIQSADSLGFGFRDLVDRNLFWVLSRLTLEIDSALYWYDEIIVETWPKTIHGILYIRDFHVRDKQGRIIVRASSGWLSIDLQRKRPSRRLSEENPAIFTELKERHALADLPEKLDPATAEKTFELHPGYFDIDLNQHVTSSRYIDWMMDSFGFEFHRDHYPKKLTVNYIKETLPGEYLQIRRQEKTNRIFLFEGINRNTNSSAFRGKIDF